MRDTRTVQLSIFDFYPQHEMGMQLERLSDVLDSYPFLRLVEADLKVNGGSELGRKALTVESVFRCMILKQMLGVSYAKLAFHLSDSQSYRSFARVTYANAQSQIDVTVE